MEIKKLVEVELRANVTVEYDMTQIGRDSVAEGLQGALGDALQRLAEDEVLIPLLEGDGSEIIEHHAKVVFGRVDVTKLYDPRDAGDASKPPTVGEPRTEPRAPTGPVAALREVEAANAERDVAAEAAVQEPSRPDSPEESAWSMATHLRQQRGHWVSNFRFAITALLAQTTPIDTSNPVSRRLLVKNAASLASDMVSAKPDDDDGTTPAPLDEANERVRIRKAQLPEPTPEDLKNPVFDAIWQIIKGWDIDNGRGPHGATGNHASAILHGLYEWEDAQLKQLSTFIMGKIDGEPSRSEGAVECAIRLLDDWQRWMQEAIKDLDDDGDHRVRIANALCHLRGMIPKDVTK